MLTPEQSKEIKKQLITYIEKLYPGQKEILSKQINSLSPEELELFLKQNKIQLKQAGDQQTPSCIFCSIIENKISSYKISENSDAIAVLEINPVSKAHAIIIPKKHIVEIEKIPQSAFKLAEEISKKIKAKFKPKQIQTIPSVNLGHAIINIIPTYKDKNINSERKQASEKELLNLQKKLMKKSPTKTIKKSKPKKITQKLWLPKRIP